MKQIIIIICLAFFSCNIFSQKRGDTKIQITLPNEISAFTALKRTLINNDFLIKDLGVEDSIATYPRELMGMAGFAILHANISGQTITLFGSYGLKKIDFAGYNSGTNKYLNIYYYPLSKTWKLLNKIAKEVGGDIVYTK